MTTTTIGERIKTVRKERKMTLEEVSKIVKVSRQTIQRYESGVIASIPSDKIELLSQALNVSPAYLMGWSDKYYSIDAQISRLTGKLLATKDEERKEIVREFLECALTLPTEQLKAVYMLVKTMK